MYGDDVDKIVQGNVSNIVFLKSTDDEMIDTLSKMSGTTHVSMNDQKMITRDLNAIWLNNEGKVSYTMSTTERPVVSYNDMAFISQRNSIIFRAGDAPIWNRNETILPMSWRLLRQKCITQPGKEYTLQTIPTLSSAAEFDVRKNQPDFQKMLDKRIAQALKAKAATAVYKEGYGYNDFDMAQLDPDTVADEIMTLIDTFLNIDVGISGDEAGCAYVEDVEPQFDYQEMKPNEDVIASYQAATKQKQDRERKRWAGNMLSIADLMGDYNTPVHALDQELIAAYLDVRGDFEQDHDNFVVRGGSLCSVDGSREYIVRKDASADLQKLQAASQDPESRVYAESAEDVQQFGAWEVTDDFLRFLAARDKWDFARGRFEEALARQLKSK